MTERQPLRLSAATDLAADATLEPLKIVGELHAIKRTAQGDVVWDGPVGTIVVYAPHFDTLAETVRERWPALLAQLEGAP